MVWNKGLKGEEYRKHYKNGFGGTQNKGRLRSEYPLVYDKNWLMEQHYGFDKTVEEMADMIGCKRNHIYQRMYELKIPIIDEIHLCIGIHTEQCLIQFVQVGADTHAAEMRRHANGHHMVHAIGDHASHRVLDPRSPVAHADVHRQARCVAELRCNAARDRQQG